MGSHGAAPRRRVVVTADDAGLRADWDRAIVAARESGVVTAISVVTGGPTYPELRTRLLDAPAADVGVHLNVTHGRPLSPASDVRSLVDAGGRFCGSIHRFLLRYLAARVSTEDLAREWELQVQRARDDGLRPTHLNSHYHVHLLPGLFDIAVSLARRFGIQWLRVADEPPWPLAAGRLRPTSLLVTTGLWLASLDGRRRLASAGLGLHISSVGAAFSGKLGPAEWRELLGHLGGGTAEIVCHPGQSQQEVSALTSGWLPHEIRKHAILCRFRDMGVDP